ncbi:MAG: TolC family protein, partial [Nitratireductor sp.]
ALAKSLEENQDALNSKTAYSKDSDQEPTVIIADIDPAPKKVEVPENTNTELASLIEATIESNPEIAIARAQEDDAEIAIGIANANYHPQIDLTLTRGRENTYSKTTTQLNVDRREANIILNQTLIDFGGRKNSVARRDALYESAKLRRKDVTEKVALEITEAYMGFLKQVSLTNIAKKNVKSHKEMAKLVKLSEQGGNATIADVKRVETRLDSANSAKLNSEDALKDTITAFKRLTGISPYNVKKPKKIVPKVRKSIKEQWRNVASKNPKLLSLEADRLSLEKQLKQQKAKLLPEIYGTVEANYKDNVGGETGVARDVRGMLGVRVRLYDGGARLGAAQQIEARILEADARHLKLHRELTENLENNNQELQSSKKKSSFLGSSFKAAKKVMALYKQQFKAGTRTPFELLDAQRDLFKAEQDVINHRYDTALANYRDLRLRGKLVENLKSL